MIIAGLTGGIASGKSTVSRFLGELGAVIIDADKIAREVVAPGTPAHGEIVRTFGTGILLHDSTIDRKGLGDIIFNDPEKKERLNAIVHPRVFEAMNEKIAKAAAADPDAVIILDVPLLFEAGTKRDLAEIIVVYSPEAVQLRRLMKRDQIDEKSAMARIRSQMPIEEKRKRATLVIDNTENSEKTLEQAGRVFQYLRERPTSSSAIPDPLHRVQG